MAMVLVRDGASLRFIDDGASLITAGIKATKERAMTKKTKTALEQENNQLQAKVETLTWENNKLAAALAAGQRNEYEIITRLREELTATQKELARVSVSKPSAVSQEEKDRRLADLPKHTPHQEMECTVHGKGRANREGYCFQCYCIAKGKPEAPVAVAA